MAFNPWEQAAKISNIFGVDSAVLQSGARWSNKWQQAASKAQSTARTVTSAKAPMPSATFGRTGTNGVMIISRTKAQQMEFYARKAERERRDAENAERKARRLSEQANKASLKESQRLDRLAEMAAKEAERLMKQAIATQNKIMRDDERDTKVLSKAKMQRFENQMEKELRLMKAARPIARQRVTVGRPKLVQVELPPKFSKYGGGASVTIDRNSPYIKKLSHRNLKDYRKVAKLVKQVEEAARSLSQGPYSLQQLARLGHPYSKRHTAVNKLTRINAPMGGSRRDVVNKQTGTFLRSWGTNFSLTPSGFEAQLYNTAPYAWFLANGTKKMVAHGPWKAAFDMYMPQINQEFSRIALNAQRTYLQQEADKQVLRTMTTQEKQATIRRWKSETTASGGSSLTGLAGGVLQ